MQKTFILLFLFLSSVLSQQKSPEPDQVIEIFRHGARGPINAYDPQWSEAELGQLTSVGMVEQYNLGKQIAKRYPKLVESGYNPDEVFVLSNYVQRCIESAMVQVSSIFRGKTSTLKENPQKDLQEKLIQQFTPLLPKDEVSRGDYVPVKVDVVSGLDQELIFNGNNPGYCSRLSTFVSRNEDSQETKDAYEIFKDPVRKANALLPEELYINDLGKLVVAYDTFIADVFDNKTLPGGIDDPKLIKSLSYGEAYAIYRFEQGQQIQNQLNTFSTMEAVLEQMANFRAGKNPKKLALYGGHDKNLYAILVAFGIVTEECVLANYESHTKDKAEPYPNCQYPGFASHMIFELYNNEKNPYVKFYYNDVLIPLCGGQESCGYQDFIAFVRNSTGNNTLESWNHTCQNHFKVTFWMIVGPLIAVLLGAIVVMGWIYLRRTRVVRKMSIEDQIMLKPSGTHHDTSH